MRSFSGHSADSMASRDAHVAHDSRVSAMQLTEKQFAIEGLGAPEKEDELREIFEAVKKGELPFAEFKKGSKIRLRFFYI